jgi:hypothetical protein
MADFVAVIRKAVDGLANNTPETRSKVYEKARSAVVRQLENMKPRPPEELLNRQIAKLDAAIAEVESEHAVALPAIEDDDIGYEADEAVIAHDDGYDARNEPAQAYDSAPEADEEPVQHYEAESEPAAYRADDEIEPAPAHYVEPDYPAQTYEAEVEPQPVAEVAAYEPAEPAQSESYEDQWQDSRETIEPAPVAEAAYEPEPSAQAEAEPELEHAHANWVGADSPEAQVWAEEQASVQSEPAHTAETDVYAGQWTQSSSLDDDHVAAPVAAPSADPFDSSYTSAQQYEQDVHVEIAKPAFDAMPDDRRALDAAADDIFGADAPYHDDKTSSEPEPNYGAAGAVAGAAIVGAAAASTANQGSDDFKRFFDDAIDQSPRSTGGLPRADEDPFSKQTEGGKRDAWDDLEDLIGYDSREAGDNGKDASLSANDGTLRGETGSVIPPNVYVKPKKNRTKEMILGTVAVLIIAGGAYALYQNRAALNDVVGGLTESAQTETQPAGGNANGNATPEAGTAQGTAAPSGTDSADNGETTGTKFTQRLLADGTEKDEGQAPVAGNQPVTAEGVSQAEKNEEAPATDAPAAAPAAPSTSAPANSQTPAVAVAGEPMFLYEEVLGQSAPSAIAGTVAWSLSSEADANGAPSPTVQAQLSVPERGITALMTFKKNTDASLPASHIVEIVFSTGAGFEGGAIDSVQRIAMKSTEQDRGNALIAVPAKITDDFHMIALNDFPDALKTNLELLRSRDWLDIPLAYRNGRRALLTLQKGPAGKQAFEQALREWQAAAPAAQ